MDLERLNPYQMTWDDWREVEKFAEYLHHRRVMPPVEFLDRYGRYMGYSKAEVDQMIGLARRLVT